MPSPVAAEVATLLAKKNRATLFKKYVEAKLADAGACETWASFEETMASGWVAVVKAVCALPRLRNGDGDPVLASVRALIEPHDDVKFFAFIGAYDALCDDEAAAAPKVGAKRARDGSAREAAEATPVLANILDLLHGVPVPKKKSDQVAVRFGDLLKRLRDAHKKRAAASADGQNAKQRNKKAKEGVMQLFTASCHQRVFSELWLGCFRSSRLTKEQLLFLLDGLHEKVIPYLSSPLTLFDFLSDAYNEGGLAGILALNSLFVLMAEHGLEFPAFFDRLYQLLTPDVCMTRYRGRFFELVGKFMGSIGLSAGVVAAFAKKACRLALHAPTPAVFFLTSLVKLLLIKHPQVMPLIHRELADLQAAAEEEGSDGGDAAEEPAGIWAGKDPFSMHAQAPEDSHALDSSCWELRGLLNHSNPTISATTKEMTEELRQPIGGTVPIIQARAGRTYSRMIQREVLREIKGVPTAAYTNPVPFQEEKDTALTAAFAF